MTPNEAHFEELNARIEALERQRNDALTDAVVARGKLSVATVRLVALEKSQAELSAKLAALVTP